MKNNSTTNARARRDFLKLSSFFILSPLLAPARDFFDFKKNIDACSITTKDYYGEGPYGPTKYSTVNVPFTNKLARASEPGTRLKIRGTAYKNDCITPVSGVYLELWHANDSGLYDVNIDPNYRNLRGKILTDAQGRYSFDTILPGKYLNGSSYRPAHIHFLIRHENINYFTQLYFAGDPDIATDGGSSPTSGPYDATERIIELTTAANGKKTGLFNIKLNETAFTTTQKETKNEFEGFLNQNAPNPFTNFTEINFGVYKPAHVKLQVADSNGHLVKTLLDQQMGGGRFVIQWNGKNNNGTSAGKGIYVCSLFFNNQLMKYIKIVKA